VVCIFTDTKKISFTILTNSKASVIQTLLKVGKQSSRVVSSLKQHPEEVFGEDNPKHVHCDTERASVAKRFLHAHTVLSFYARMRNVI
jgi:hypothetical protein